MQAEGPGLTPFTAVTSNKLPAIIEDGQSQLTVISTATTVHVFLLKGQVFHLPDGKEAGPVTRLVVMFGNQGRTIGPHQAGNVWPNHVNTRDLFKGPQDGIVIEGSPLANDVVTQLVGTPHLNYLKEGILDDRE